MTVILLAIVGTIQQYSSGWLSDLAEGPQTFMTGMMENGVWAPADKGKALNPNFKSNNRHGSYKPNGQ